MSEPRPTQGLSIEEIGMMMGGAHDMDVARPGGGAAAAAPGQGAGAEA